MSHSVEAVEVHVPLKAASAATACVFLQHVTVEFITVRDSDVFSILAPLNVPITYHFEQHLWYLLCLHHGCTVCCT
jgi:hypothetical protein